MANKDLGIEGASLPYVENGGEASEQKPDMMTLLTIMIRKIDAQAKQAQEQACEAEQRVGEHAEELRFRVHEGLRAVSLEAQRFIDE